MYVCDGREETHRRPKDEDGRGVPNTVPSTIPVDGAGGSDANNAETEDDGEDSEEELGYPHALGRHVGRRRAVHVVESGCRATRDWRRLVEC